MDAAKRAIFQEIQKMYDVLLPLWMAEYERTGNMHQSPHVRNWEPEFSPIEHNVWGEIREYGLPFYPQIPVAGFFLDFACPMLKIAIECDGAEFHDADKDFPAR
jgi:very-short-patch-repair endonuclease